jgi:hypothetical protein
MGSGGGGGGGNPQALYQNAAPMKNLPIAGEGGGVGSPWEYGQFQNFLPDIKAEGQNPMATGLRPDMFKYKSPSGVVAESDTGNQIKELRDALAALQAGQTTGNEGKNQFGAADEGMNNWHNVNPAYGGG